MRRAEELYHSALERPESERDAFLARACEGDGELLGEVRSLLGLARDARRMLDEPVAGAATVPLAVLPGTRLGCYEVLEPIGAGGMGEVYRARDTRLDRTVALKVMPSQGASDPAARRRFEREARAISSLNHPHICTLHDIGSQDGVDYLVMEHIEGETLAHRLKRGALSLDRALMHGVEIADALDKAHRQGVVHRDLKPGNIMLTKSGVKLLDFGLAKLHQKPRRASAGSAPPEEAGLQTAEGIALGTPQYMAPEQVEGGEADARTDVFAFGSVLFEMLTGRKAFQGESQTSLLAAIAEREPPAPSELQPTTPPLLDRAVRRCLEKDPDQRWQSAGDLAIELRSIAEAGPPRVEAAAGSDPRSSPRARWIGGALVLAAAVGAGVGGMAVGRGWLRDVLPGPARGVTRFTVAVSPGQYLVGGHQLEAWRLGRRRPSRRSFSLSPDGRQLLYVASDGAIARLHRRAMDQMQATPLPDSEGASFPFFAPDGEAAAFFVGNQLERLSVANGEVRAITTLGPAFDAWRGASWTASDTILLASADGIFAVPSSGGRLARVTTVDPSSGEVAFPLLLPGGRAVLYNLALGPKPSEWTIVVESLESGQRQVVVEGGSDPRYVPSGHVLFMRAGTLMAMPFDVGRLRATGSPIAVVEDVMHAEGASYTGLNTGAGQFSVSGSGTLAYVSGGIYPANRTSLVWVDQTGTVEPLPLPQGQYWQPRISPDGQRLAYAEGPFGDVQIWVYDIELKTPVRLTRAGHNVSPVWSPDGTRLAFASVREGQARLVSMAADGSGEPRPLDGGPGLPSSWSPEGVLAFVGVHDIWVVSMEGDVAPRPFFETPFEEGWPAFSPDGRWLAYASNETGSFEVWVRPFPAGEPARRVSTTGGISPLWSPDQKQLFFRSIAEDGLPQGIMVVDVDTAADFDRREPRRLLDNKDFGGTTPIRSYDITPDGSRFVVFDGWSRAEYLPATGIHLALNWVDELPRRALAN